MTSNPRLLRTAGLVALFAAPLALTECRREQPAVPPQQEAVMPATRSLAPAEQSDLAKALQQRFRQGPSASAQYGAAGPFRIIVSDRFQYMERADVGSVVFER